MIQRISSAAVTVTGTVIAAAPVADSAWSLVGVVCAVLGGIWLMTRETIKAQSARIDKLAADHAECEKGRTADLVRIARMETRLGLPQPAEASKS